MANHRSIPDCVNTTITLPVTSGYWGSSKVLAALPWWALPHLPLPALQAKGAVTTTTLIAYTYDPLFRLTDATYSGDYTYTFAYAYDAVGNPANYGQGYSRTAQTQTITSTQVTNYVYDAANRLTSVNGQAYTWDDNGNLVNDGDKTYTYDQANRLTAVSGQSSAVTYAYNGEGARLKQIVNGSVTTYTLDLAAPLVQVLVMQDANGKTAYLYGVTRIGEQQVAGWVYHLSDALGSVRQLADANAQVVLVRGYTPYGEPLWAQGIASSRYAFTGEDYDPSVGLLFLRARYLQPTLGIFLARDPWSGDQSRPQSMNGWDYADDDPVNNIDPSGREPKPYTPPDFNGLGPIAMNGYIEGVMFSKSAFFQNIEISGIEIVYDFVTHERMRFTYTGYWKEWCGLNTSLADVSYSIYAGWYGFKDQPIEVEYGGPFFNFSANASVSLPFMPKARVKQTEFSGGLGVNGGWNILCEATGKGLIMPDDDLSLPGVDWATTRCGASVGIGGSGGLGLGLPVGIGTFFTDYRPDLHSRTHYTELSSMTHDILLGWNAPGWATTLLNPIRQYIVDNVATVIWETQLALFGER